MGQGKGKEIAGPIIREVVSYTKTHFRNEEGYLERFGYPQTAAHKLKHVDFVDRIAKFEEDFKSRRLGLSLDLMKFLKDWLLTHIKGTDMRYAPFLIERGVR
jgi:hemerythrin